MLAESDLKKFKELYKKHYGIDLSDQEASAYAGQLLELVGAVLK